MIKSMTGFGRGRYENEGREYLIEVKSINHKYADINLRAPRFFNGIEYKIRNEIAQAVSRGKIDVYIEFRDNSADESSINFNKELAKVYIKELQELGKETGINYDFNVIDISKMPDVLRRDDEIDEDLIFNELKNALIVALDDFNKMREVEGSKLKKDILNRLELISNKVLEIKEESNGMVEEYITKLNNRIKELMPNDVVVDEARLAQEIVIYSDKTSVEEELTRLDSHIMQFKKMLEGDSPIGKKLDFLIQEINRETNTIGSKANNIEITNRVVELKTEIENIREQIQNIE